MSYLFKEEKTIIILFILTIVALIFIRINDSRDTALVFSDMGYEYNTYIIDVSNDYITTNNLDTISTNIEEVLPFISPKYEDIIKTNWYIFDKTINYEKNISNLEMIYKKEFQENAIPNASLNIDYNGLRIEKIKLITNDISRYSKYNYQELNFE